MTNARLSDKELANLNAAAVTREYRVKPHLGTNSVTFVGSYWKRCSLHFVVDYRTVSAINGWMAKRYSSLTHFLFILFTRPLVVLDNVKVNMCLRFLVESSFELSIASFRLITKLCNLLYPTVRNEGVKSLRCRERRLLYRCLKELLGLTWRQHMLNSQEVVWSFQSRRTCWVVSSTVQVTLSTMVRRYLQRIILTLMVCLYYFV